MAMQTFNDELDDLPTPAAASTPAPTQTAATAAAPAQKATPAAKVAVDDDDENPAATAVADNENLDTDFDDEKVYARPGQLNQCRPEKGKAKRFAFVPKEWLAPQTAKGHFTEIGVGKDIKKGRYRCLSGLGVESKPEYCCTALGKDGEINVVALVISYTNADGVTGKYGKDDKVEFAIEFVRLSQFNMRQIKKLPDEDKTPFDIDLVMTHADRAFGYEFNRKANAPRWKSDPTVEAAVKAAVSRFLDGKALRSKLGQKLNEIEWKALLSGKKVGGDAKLDNVDEL